MLSRTRITKRLLPLLALIMVCGCSDEAETTIDDSVAALCNRYCESYPLQLDSCPSETDYSAPRQVCKSQCVLYLDSQECRASMMALADCNPSRTFACGKNSSLYTIVEPDPCEPYEDDFSYTPGGSGGRCVDPDKL